MNINELDNYDLGDAVKFNDRLNPALWTDQERLRPEVRAKLMAAAEDFATFLGVTDFDLKDITVSGSNAAYTYTPHSDIDLHLVVDLPEADASEVFRELFDAKKYQYNDMHDIKIKGYDVELYVQNANQPHVSQGIYSVLNDEWVQVPRRRKVAVDDVSTRSKYETLAQHIEQATASADLERITALANKIKKMRQSGLETQGEFGPENLAFKILRTQGLIDKLYAARNAAKDQLLSLDERKKKKKKKAQARRWGHFGGYWYPGTGYAGQDTPAAQEAGDGGGDGGAESMNESTGLSDEKILQDFIQFVVKELKIEHMPRVKLRKDPEWPKRNKTFGRYNDDAKTLEVAWGNRHIMDVLRTVAHELTHKRQHEREDVPASAGETGSEYENEANARAGVLMRDWARLHPEHFDAGQAHGLHADKLQEFAPQGYSQRYSIYMDDYELRERFAELEDAIEAIEQYKRDDPKSRFMDYNIRDINGQVVWRNDAWQDLARPSKTRFLPPKDVTETAPIGFVMPGMTTDPVTAWKQQVRALILQYREDPTRLGDLAKEKGPDSAEATAYAYIRNPQARIPLPPGAKVKESASGYIPTRAQARDPRFSMALTVDIKPGQVGKEANKLKLKTDRQGHPQIARANGLFENLYREYRKFKADEDYDPDHPPGPESKPTMPKGTLRVDVSDMYDWYKMGQHISNMKGLGKHDFGKGPPSTIISFGDEDTEHKFIGDIEATGLDVTDIDPADPKRRPGRKIKTDPTYNVDESEQNFAIASQPIPGDKFRLTINNRPFILTPGGFGKQHSQVFLDSFYLTDMKSGKTEFVDSWYNWPMAKAIADHLDQNHADALVRIGKADFAWHEKNNDWDSQPPRLQGIRRQTSVGIPAKDFVKSVDAVKRVTGQDRDLNEDEDLDEVKMSPGALEKFATSPAAKGIRAGFEAELIFRDTQGESEELDPEPNYDADERAYSIQQVIEFFENDEYGYGLSDRQRNRLENDLDERYMEWRDEQIISDFRNDAEDLIRDILLEETPMDQRIHFYLTDSLQMSDEEADAVVKAGADAPKFTNSDAQKDYADENPEYKTYLEAADEAEQELEESVEFSVNRQDEYWDEALDKYRDDYSGDDDSFFSDVGLRWMSDVANEFNLDWPVWDGGQQQNYGSRGWEDIGNSLQDVVDMPVVVSSNYHTTKRRPGQWIIEPDGSLDPDDKGEEAGLEIVSPPMPLLTAIEKLKQVTDWANDPNGGNAYTNSSTGLHMGVSLPSMKSEAAGEDIGIDYVKLILFLGDKYVQQQFGREANTYCASALEKLKQNIKGKRSDPAGVVKLLQHGLTELAHRELQKGVGTSKYTSAHIQPGYIEFRSPGGDWLAKADEEIGVLENTMLRFARAMAIAGDPNAERQEYAKKLYKLVTADNPEYADQLKLFSEFSAGTINKEQLKKQWADTVLQKELPGVGKEEYEVYRRDNGNSPDATVGTLYARDYDDAYDQFLRQYGRDINDLDVRIKQPWFDIFDEKGKVVATIRAKDVDTATDRAQYEFGERWTDAWKIYRRPDDTPEPKASPRAQVAKRIAQPKPKAVGDDDASDWEAVYKPTGRVFDTLAHADTAQALAWRDIVMRSHGFDNVSDILVRRAGHQQAADARRDSADLQRNLGVQDVDIDVTQNFDPSAYERNSERIDAIRAQSQQPRQNWELVSDEDPNLVVHRMNDATADEVRAWIAQQEAGGMPAGFLRTRIVAESTGQHDDEQTRTALDMAASDFNYKNWADVEMRGSDEIKTAIQRHAVTKLDLAQSKPFNMLGKSRSAIVKGVAQADRELIDKQIATARKLGDDVNENFADKKVSGKSRPGRVKRAGASCKGSVTDLRARAKKYGGEKGKMYHWCANMKSGRKK